MNHSFSSTYFFWYNAYNFSSSSATIINTGTIVTTDTINARGISASTANITNTGYITSAKIGVYIYSASTLINSGTIQNTTLGNSAILADAGIAGNTVILNPGSIIVGSIDSQGGDNTLQLNLGSAKSYVYETTGSWILQDLNNRPVVAGSAMAAGIGAQETAGEMLYEHTAAINDIALKKRSGFWIDPYFTRTIRGADAADPAINAFSNQTYGVSMGMPLSVEKMAFTGLLNLQSSTLNIDDSTQKIQADSVMMGVSGQYLKALVGVNYYDGKRQVLVNTNTTGSAVVTSHYKSYTALLGANFNHHYPWKWDVAVKSRAGLDLAVEQYQQYAESSYFSWNRRFLAQGSAYADLGLQKPIYQEKAALFTKVGVAARSLLSGQKVNYTINTTPVTFEGGKRADIYLNAAVGAEYSFNKEAFLSLSGSLGSSHAGVKNKGAHLGLNVAF